MLTIGVDVGGTAIKAVLAGDAGTVLAELRVPTPRPGPGVAERVADAVRECVERLRARASPAAVGVAVPGIVDETAGLAVFSENLGWRDAPLRDMLAERIALPVAFGHDVRTGALAEARLGAGRGYRDSVFLPIGTGISAGLILDGQPYSAHGYAGEIGHVDMGHPEPCACGATGCLEAIASAAAIARRYTARTGLAASGAAEVLDAARRGDTAAGIVWDEALDAIARALAIIASVLAPEVVIIGGGLALVGSQLIEPLRGRLEARLTFQSRPHLRAAALGDLAAGLGAALLAIDLLSHALDSLQGGIFGVSARFSFAARSGSSVHERLSRIAAAQGRVVGQDVLVQAAQFDARLEAELVDRRLTSRQVQAERVRPAAKPVQRQHEQRAQPLAQRVLGEHPAKLGRHHIAAAEREVRLGLRLDGQQPALLDAVGGGADQRGLHVRERMPAPQPERGVEEFGGGERITAQPGGLTATGDHVEFFQIHADSRAAQQVARSAGHQEVGHVLAERLAQP